MCTLDKSHATLITFLNMRMVNSMLDYDMLDIGMLDITASPILHEQKGMEKAFYAQKEPIFILIPTNHPFQN
jgi:hypothetical protein